MKLASLRTGGRDGTLIVVSRDLSRAVAVPDIAPTLQSALDDWANLSPRLATVAEALGALGLRRSRSSATRASVTEAEYPPA